MVRSNEFAEPRWKHAVCGKANNGGREEADQADFFYGLKEMKRFDLLVDIEPPAEDILKDFTFPKHIQVASA